MKRLPHLLTILLLIGALSGCASMSKNECLNANWESIGYGDGSRGVHYTKLEKHRQSCAEYQVVPDHDAYRHGWEQGIRNYCRADNGYRTGRAGKPHRTICPADVAPDYLAGWQRGVRQYCTPENGLRQGLNGKRYSGICPVDLEPAYRDFYKLGQDVRTARAEHQRAERDVKQMEKRLAAEQHPDAHRKLLHQLERLQHREARSDATMIAVEACMSSDWFDAGFRDGEDGYARRAGEIASICRGYGIAADRAGYRQGWQQGNQHYCTYKSGLYLGQTNQPYSGVCAGMQHQRFWQGYERGRGIYRADRYEAHPKPVKKKVVKRSPPMTHQYQKPAQKSSKNGSETEHVEHDHHDRLKQPVSAEREESEGRNRDDKNQSEE